VADAKYLRLFQLHVESNKRSTHRTGPSSQILHAGDSSLFSEADAWAPASIQNQAPLAARSLVSTRGGIRMAESGKATKAVEASVLLLRTTGATSKVLML
jgi:hypothetical protein